MVLSKGTLLFWLLASLTVGLACGYLFSSKFCSVSIGKRVEKISTLNQKLRKLFAEHSFYAYEYIQSQFLKMNNQEAAHNHFLQVNAQIGSLISAYYDKQAGQKISNFLDKEITVINDGNTASKWAEDFATFMAQLNPTWAFSFDSLKNNFYQNATFIKQIIEAMKKQNWHLSLDLLKKDLDTSLEIADEVDKGITQQFSHKF